MEIVEAPTAIPRSRTAPRAGRRGLPATNRHRRGPTDQRPPAPSAPTTAGSPQWSEARSAARPGLRPTAKPMSARRGAGRSTTHPSAAASHRAYAIGPRVGRYRETPVHCRRQPRPAPPATRRTRRCRQRAPPRPVPPTRGRRRARRYRPAPTAGAARCRPGRPRRPGCGTATSRRGRIQHGGEDLLTPFGPVLQGVGAQQQPAPPLEQRSVIHVHCHPCALSSMSEAGTAPRARAEPLHAASALLVSRRPSASRTAAPSSVSR